MIRRVSFLLAAFIALHVAPAWGYDAGDRIGPVIINPGGTVCDTAEDTIEAIRVLDGSFGTLPASCGFLKVALPAFIEFVGHYESAGRTFAIVKILFLPPARLGIQYGWTLDRETDEGVST